MPQSLSRVYVHVVFSTKYRASYISEAIAPELFSFIAGVCNNLECNPVAVGGYLNHVHILCLLSRKVAQMDLVSKVKSNSSRWAKARFPELHDIFDWQDGYGIFSVSKSNVYAVTKYINTQVEHHSNMIFEDEFLCLLKKHNIDYDERYIWD